MDIASRACRASRIKPSIRRFTPRCWPQFGNSIRSFPQNLPLATLCAWLLLPLFLAALWFLLRDYGFSLRERYVLILMAALSPVTVVFSFSLMPELLFTALLLASLILAERAMKPDAPPWLALPRVICAALAYLAKSIAAPLLFTVPLCFALRKQFRKAALFLRRCCQPSRDGNGGWRGT